MKLAGIVARFNAQKTGNGWEARCPAHDDQHPSLSIKGGDKHPVVLKCGANCSTADVLAAVGLSFADCYPEGKRQSTTPLRTFDYTDEQGTIEYQVRRYDRATNKFAMFHLTAEGWAKGRGPGPKRLYRLSQLAAEPDVLNVWLPEGERDADSLADHCGILTTTAAGGDITNADTTPLRGKHVVVVIDNDRAGWLKGRKTAAAATAAGAFVCDVWRPTDAFKDATEAIRAGKDCDTGFVYCVDLSEDGWIHEKWPGDEPEERPKWTATGPDGKAHYGIVPTGLLLDPRHNGNIDLVVWLLLDEKAGKSGKAVCTQRDLANALGTQRQTIGKAITRLSETGWLVKDKRACYLVINPARISAKSTTATTPSPPTNTPYPSERSSERAFVTPTTNIQQVANVHRNEHPDELVAS